MTEFALEIAGLLVAAYIVGCLMGCWLRRTLSRKRYG